MPVLVTVGVLERGDTVLIRLDMRGSESAQAWRGVLRGLVDRGLRPAELVIADGGDGLLNAIETVWKDVKIQRCTVHKLRHILSHAPEHEHAHAELEEDYRRIVYVYADNLTAALAAKAFFKFPRSQWKSLRTTNVIERVHGEFRRRGKTPASFPPEPSVLLVLFGLIVSGQIRMRTIDGWQELGKTVVRAKVEVAE